MRKTSKFPKILKNCHEAIRKDSGNAFLSMPQRKALKCYYICNYLQSVGKNFLTVPSHKNWKN
ncbi:MAG: hypothetical protein DRN11_04550 [Thermoplasmata archaeon]|nr:MAG: hypothetical protein DRN11_04550 [Thermoplasmata archaeon]